MRDEEESVLVSLGFLTICQKKESASLELRRDRWDGGQERMVSGKARCPGEGTEVTPGG